MKNAELQKELKEKVRAGVKPSQLKKLKRSKSADDIANNNPPAPLLLDQLKQKQQEIENLREKLETTNTELKTLKTEQSNLLDTNLSLKHQALKEWFEGYQKNNQLAKELAENIAEASNELEKQDNLITNLRTENKKLKQEKTSLQKDLNLAQKLIELRKDYHQPNSEASYWKYAWYTLILVYFISLLNNSWKQHFNKDN